MFSEVIGAVPGIVGSAARRVVEIVRRDVADELADHGEAFGVVGCDEMGDAAFGVVGHGAAEFLHRHFLVRHGLDHVRTGDEHVGRVASHEDEVGDGGRIDGAAGARAEDRADLRDHAARERVAQENVRVARERLDAFLNARAARIVQADHGRARAHGEVHDFRDLAGVRLRERAAEDGEVLREDVDQAPVDVSVAGDEAVARGALRFHAEVVRLVADELVEFLEGAFIEQQVDALAGAELAFLVLAGVALRASAGFGFGVALAKLLRGGRRDCGGRS